MTQFLRKSLRDKKALSINYAHRPPADCDLSLVSGPLIWDKEIKSALEIFTSDELRAYPLPAQNVELIKRLAIIENVDLKGIWLTPGADAAIEIVLTRCLESGSRFGILLPNFPRFYTIAASIKGVEILDFNGFQDIPENLTAVAICTPNNPSTREVDEGDLRDVIHSFPDTIFIIDGAFDWTASYHLSSLCVEFDNVVILKSFSKIGLAGLRLGYILASPELCSDIKIALSPFYVPSIVQKIGVAIAKNLDRIDEFKNILTERYCQIKEVLGNKVERKSEVPFYLLKTKIESSLASKLLFEKGISVVDGGFFPGLPKKRLRVAIGNSNQNARLLSMLNELEIVD